MIKRRSVLKLMAAPALMTVARPGFAQTKEKVTYAYLLDPAYDAVTWAMSNGKVDLRPDHGRGARACDPAADPGDVGQAVRRDHDGGDRRAAGGGARPRAAGAVDRASAIAGRRGRPASGSRSDSPIKNPKELKGKSLGSYALRSTGYTQVRLALIQKYGLNAALEGGDVKQVEIQAPNLPGALAAGQIDAATLIHSQAFRALKSGEFRPIAETGRDNIEAFGMRFISALNVSYPERLAQRPGGVQGVQPHVPRVGALCAGEPRRGVRARSASRTTCRPSSSTGGSRRAPTCPAPSMKATPGSS